LEIEPFVAACALEPPLDQMRQPVPALLRGVKRIKRTNRLLVRGLDLGDPFVVADRLGPIPRDLLRNERDFGEQLGAASEVRGGGNRAFVELPQFPPLLTSGQHLFEPLERALVPRLQ
jgi:hypothetical protein